MSLQQLQSEIEKKAEDEATRILHAANQEAQKIVAEAETKASSVRGERTAALKRELDAQEKAQLAIARMERKGELLQVKANWAKRIFDEAEKKLGEMAQERGREYHELLNNLVLEGIKKIDGTKFIVEVNSRDKEIVKPILNTITQKAGKIKNSEIVLRMESLQSRTIGCADNHGSNEQGQRQIAFGINDFSAGEGDVVPSIGGKQRPHERHADNRERCQTPRRRRPRGCRVGRRRRCATNPP